MQWGDWTSTFKMTVLSIEIHQNFFSDFFFDELCLQIPELLLIVSWSRTRLCISEDFSLIFYTHFCNLKLVFLLLQWLRILPKTSFLFRQTYPSTSCLLLICRFLNKCFSSVAGLTDLVSRTDLICDVSLARVVAPMSRWPGPRIRVR